MNLEAWSRSWFELRLGSVYTENLANLLEYILFALSHCLLNGVRANGGVKHRCSIETRNEKKDLVYNDYSSSREGVLVL